jgi:YVTN family beta-propeller protein
MESEPGAVVPCASGDAGRKRGSQMLRLENSPKKTRVLHRTASVQKHLAAASMALATALAASTLAGPASAEKVPPIPTLINIAIDMGLGAGAGAYSPVIGQYPTFTGQSTGVVIDPNTGNIYYSNYLGDIHVVTPSNDAATAKDVTIDPDYAVVYAKQPNSSLVESVITSVASQCQNFGVVNDPGIDTVTQNVFVPCGGENLVYIINEATNNIVASIPVKTPWGVAADETTGTLYVAQSSPTNTVSVISEKTNTVTATIPVGRYSEYLAVDSKNKQLFVSNYQDATVSVIDTKTNKVKTTIQLGVVAGLCFR